MFPDTGEWLVTRWSDCQTVGAKDALFGPSNSSGRPEARVMGMPNVLTMSGPSHACLRKGIDSNLGSDSVNGFIEELARPIIRRYIDAIRDEGLGRPDHRALRADQRAGRRQRHRPRRGGRRHADPLVPRPQRRPAERRATTRRSGRPATGRARRSTTHCGRSSSGSRREPDNSLDLPRRPRRNAGGRGPQLRGDHADHARDPARRAAGARPRRGQRRARPAAGPEAGRRGRRRSRRPRPARL